MKPDFITASKQNILFFAREILKNYGQDGGCFLTPTQNQILLKMAYSKNYVLNVPRQTGKSMLCMLYALQQAALNDAMVVYILPNNIQATNISDLALKLIRTSPYYNSVVSRTSQYIRFVGGGEITFLSSRVVENGCRGKSHDIVIVDDADYVEEFDAFFKCLFPVISKRKKGQMILTGTNFKLNGIDIDKFKNSPEWTVDQFGWEKFFSKDHIEAILNIVHDNDRQRFSKEFPSQKDF